MKPEEWDWSRTVIDHLDLHARRFSESVRFYETVLAPLGIPKLSQREGAACFTHLNVTDAQPPTMNLHLYFHAGSKGPGRRLLRRRSPGGLRAERLARLPTTLLATTLPTYSTRTETTWKRSTATWAIRATPGSTWPVQTASWPAETQQLCAGERTMWIDLAPGESPSIVPAGSPPRHAGAATLPI
jgi:hypothetical protein